APGDRLRASQGGRVREKPLLPLPPLQRHRVEARDLGQTRDHRFRLTRQSDGARVRSPLEPPRKEIEDEQRKRDQDGKHSSPTVNACRVRPRDLIHPRTNTMRLANPAAKHTIASLGSPSVTAPPIAPTSSSGTRFAARPQTVWRATSAVVHSVSRTRAKTGYRKRLHAAATSRGGSTAMPTSTGSRTTALWLPSMKRISVSARRRKR